MNGFSLILILLIWMIGDNLLNATGPVYRNTLPVSAPSNDNLCDAIPLILGETCNGYSYTTVEATLEANEPSPCFTPVKTVWFSFSAPPSGTVRITTSNSNGALFMGRAIYSLGGSCNDLSNLFLYDCGIDTLTTCGLIPEQTYYVQIVSNPAPNEDDFCIEITGEVMANAGPDQTLCNTTFTTLAGNVPLFSEGLWSVYSGTATITNPTSPTSGVTGLVPGTTVTLEWNVGECGDQCPCKPGQNGLPNYSSSDLMTITVDQLPTTANAGFNRLTCNTFTVAIANTPIVGTGLWSVVSGTATLSTPTLPSTLVTGLVHGTVATLQWTITNGTCPPSTDQMTISVLTDPDAGPSQQLCTDINSTTLAANPITVGEGYWYVASGMAIFADDSSPTTSVSLTPGVATTLVWFVFFPPEGCAIRDSMMITWADPSTLADAGPDQMLCNQTSTTLAANTPMFGMGSWTVISGTATITDPSSPTTGLTGLVPGTSVTLEWSISNGACAPSADQVVITIDALPSQADAGTDQSLCNLTTTFLAANTPVDGSGMWSLISGTATITDPSSPISGVTGLLVGTSAVLQWTISNGICPASIDQVTITVYASVTPANAGPDQILCDMSTTTLAANMPITGTGVWAVVPGSTAIITDPSSPASGVTGLLPPYSVAILTWTITNGSCVSSDFMTIDNRSIPTANAGNDQQLCNTTTTTLSADPPVCFGEGVCETGLWTVISGSANITDPASPVSGVTGLIPGSSDTLQWTVYGPGGYCSDTDTIIISVDELPTDADAGPDQQMCNLTTTTLAANSPLAGTGIWSLISGTATITDPSSPTSGVTGLVVSTSAVLQWTISSGICPASIDQMTITINDLPTNSDAGPDQPLCDETATTLAGNTPVVGSGLWTVISGTAIITDPLSPFSGVTGLLTDATVILQWTITSGICPASIDQVMITVSALPTISNAGPDQQLCNQTTTTLSANNPLVGSGQWTVISGTANITNPSSPVSGVTGLIAGTTATLQWSISNGICPASTDLMTITVYALPTVSNAGADQSLCNQVSTMLAGNTPVSGTGQWSLISGTANITNPTSPTSEVTGLLADASVVLQWTITNGACPPSNDQVMITVYSFPTPSNAGPDQQLCNQASTTLAANTPVIGSGQWSLVSGTANITTPGSPTSGITGLVAGTTAVLAWTITNGTCPASVDQVSLTVYALPTTSNAGPDQQLCNQPNTILSANTPAIGSGLWSVLSGTANITNPTSPISGVTGLLSDASAVLQWTISNGTCPASSDLMIITNYALPTPSNAGPDKELCNQTTTTLSGNNPPVGSGQWSVINGTANITNPSSPVSGVTGLIPGTTATLQWSITNGVCLASTDQMTITVYALPTAANAGPDQQFCNQTTTTLSANNPSVGIGQWAVISGTANITNPSSPTSGVTGLLPGISTTLQWKITNGTCPPDVDLMKIKVDALPSPADAGPDKFLCDQSSTVVNAEEPLTGTGTWSVVSGMATVIPPDQAMAAVLNLVNGTSAILQWAVSNGTCPGNSDQMEISVSEAPTEADAGPDQLVCYSTVTNLQGNAPDVGVGYWLKLSGPGEITDPESPTSEITGLQSGVPTILQWTIWNGYCPPSSDEVMLEIIDDVVSADAGLDQLICGETTATLTGNDPGNGNGFWTIVQGVATIADPANPTTEITDLLSGNTLILEWMITNGSCPPSNDQVSIFVDQSAGFADAGPDQDLCQQETTMLEGNFPVGGSGQWTVISGNAVVFPADQAVAQVTNLVPGSSVILQWTISNGTCPPDSDQIIINVGTEPTIALAGLDQVLCNEDNALLSANTPISGAGNWSVILGQATITDPTSPTSTVTSISPGASVVLQWTITNVGCPPNHDQVLIQIDELPSTSDAGADQVFCDNSSTSLQANTPVAGQGSWTLLNGFASLMDPFSPSSTVTGLQPGQSVTLQWTITSGVCPESNDLMTIQVDHLSSMADAGLDQVLCGDNSTLINAVTPVYGQGEWIIINGNANLADPLSPVTELTDLEEGTIVTLHWTVTNGTCPPTTDEMIIQIKKAPTQAYAGIDQSFCEQTQSLLNANVPTVGTGQWEIISGSGMLADVSQSTSSVTGLVNSLPLVLQWVTTYESCQTRDTITLSTYDTPSASNAGEDQIICSSESMLNGNTPSIGIGTWTIVSGTGIISDVSNPSSTITGLIPGTSVVLQWNITNGVCPAISDEVTISVNTEIPIAAAGEDQQLCGTTITTVQALPANIGTGTWTVLSGTAIIEDSLSESTIVSGLIQGSTTVLRWTVSGMGCPSAQDDVVITIDATPLPANAGSDEIICGSEHMLSAEEPAIGTGVWSIISGIGSLQNQFDPFTFLTDVPAGTSISLEWSVTNGICPAEVDTITITAALPPAIPVASGDQILCNSPHATLSANNPGPDGGIGTWSLVSGAGEIQNINENVTTVTELGLGSNLFAWTISNGVCGSLSDTVLILNNDEAELKSNFLVSEFACTDDSVYMFDISGNATLPTGFFWDFGDGFTSTERDPIHQYGAQGDYTIMLTTILEGCGSVSTSKVIRVFNCLSNNPGNGGTRKVLYANVFPNPSDEDFQVSIKLREESEVNITLFDAVGRVTETRKITDEKDIKTIFEVEVPGLYFIHIQVGLEVLIFKVVKVEGSN